MKAIIAHPNLDFDALASMAAAVLVIAGVLTGILLRNAELRRRAEEERLRAVSNSIGESIQKSAASREESTRTALSAPRDRASSAI